VRLCVEGILGRTRAEFEGGDGQAEREGLGSAVTKQRIASRARTSKNSITYVSLVTQLTTADFLSFQFYLALV